MATVEKPTKKKTKKSKERNRTPNSTTQNADNVIVPGKDSDTENEKLFEETSPLSKNSKTDEEEDSSAGVVNTSEIHESLQTSISDLKDYQCLADRTKNLLNLECSVSSGAPISPSEEEASTENISLQEELSLAEKNSENFMEDLAETNSLKIEATAPPVDASQTPALFLATNLVDPIVHYPNLQPIQQAESSAQIIYQRSRLKSPGFQISQSNLKPFTAEQLRQFYYCSDLEYIKQFEVEYLTNSLLESYDGHPLYDALNKYYNLQSKIYLNLHDIKNLRKEFSESRKSTWTRKTLTGTESGTCGDLVVVKASVDYEVMELNEVEFQKSSESLEQFHNILCQNYVVNRVAAATTKVSIDSIIDKILTHQCTSDDRLPSKPVVLMSHTKEVLECVEELRKAVSILFFFQRKRSPNKTFSDELKSWLRKLVSLHLLLATKEDHWFLLFNLLRCPSGINQWGVPFVQIPDNTIESPSTSVKPIPLTSPEINHSLSILQILLFPIQKRNDYLKEFSQDLIDFVQEDRWILIDSDGEDCHNSNGDCNGIKENDLIALLSQIPFEQMFCSALKVEKFLGDYILDESLITSNQMLTVIAFFSKLLEIFGEGMLLYNNEKYKQLAKGLGHYLRHILQYVLDYHELFVNNKNPKDSQSSQRIVIELNSLIVKACNYIYRTRNLSTWQYFLSIPYQSLYSETIWQLLYYLSVGFPEGVSLPDKDYLELFEDPEFWTKFNIANADSSNENLYYLLHAFFEMGNGRDRQKDWDLIKTICLTIFNIGFRNKNTRDNCYKTARDMLTNLTLAYEDLMSCLILELKIRFNDLDNMVYLFKCLPLENWKPGMDNFEILSNWLLHFDYKSPENMLSRLIISRLNWSFDVNGRLFLPHNIHVRMACLISEALAKHAPEIVGLSSILEGVKQMTNLMDFSQATKEHFSNWCWSMISILRLHLMDQSVESIKRTLQNPTEPLMFVPELEKVDMIYLGVKENRTIPMVLALMITLHGHSIPLICQKGFEILKKLLNDYRYAAVVRCIELIVPLFLDNPETLANCENFHALLNGLLTADKTYLRMAKDIIYPNSIGPVMELFDNMIHHQITSYTSYGLMSPLNLINVWLNCLTSLPNWQTTSVVFLLDKILRLSYQFPDARHQAFEFFRHYYKDCSDDWKGTNKMSALKTFFGANQSKVPALSPQYPWLALILLEIEFQQQDSTFWQDFLQELSRSSNNTNIDAVLKRTLSLAKKPQFPAQMLVLFKYANLIASMDNRHPLFPIINQKFFELYLSRVRPYQEDQNFRNVYGVSDKFYEFNLPIMKRIKNNLKAAEIMYNNEALRHSHDDGLSYFYRNCAGMMKTFEIWLEDTEIIKISQNDHDFPSQYNNEKLREILNGYTHHWTEFIYLAHIREEQKNQADRWASKTFRLKNNKQLRTAVKEKLSSTALERIKRHLSSYDKPKKHPVFRKPTFSKALDINQNTKGQLKTHLKVLIKTAEDFNLKSSELNSLNRNYLDAIRELYKNVPLNRVKEAKCSNLFSRNCKQAALINIPIKTSKQDPQVVTKINKYLESQDGLIEKILNFQADNFAESAGQINLVVQSLLNYQKLQVNAGAIIIDVGVSSFYSIANEMTDVVIQFPPTNDFFSHLLNELGLFLQDNQEKEGEKILQMALKYPKLIKVLSGVFVPYKTAPESFLKFYKFLIDSYLKRCDTKILFVLFSKFDLVCWLENFQPKLHDISQLLVFILKGLESWSQPDSSLLQDQFRRHLVHIFNYDFPQHYGEVLQAVLDRVSDQKLMPIVLLDLLNSMLITFSCESLTLQTSLEKIQEISIDFSRKQNLFNLPAATESLTLFARHFQKERLHHGLHGLYPKHKDYCQALAAWFSCFGQVLITTAICTYQKLLGDQISDIVFGSLVDLYSPWLVTYTAETIIMQPTANWIKQLTENGKVLYPWSEQHSETCRIMLKTFFKSLQFALEHLPGSYKIMDHTFAWYIHHFAVPNMLKHIYAPVHESVASLPWEYFKPQPNYIDLLYDSIQKFIPECHAMLGHIFIRINWPAWFQETFPSFPINMQSPTLSKLLVIFIKISFEPNIHIHINTSKILEEATQYPLHMVEYGEMEKLLQWFVTTVEPSIILKMPIETNYSDRAVLDLLAIACAMSPKYPSFHSASNATAKRILYARSMMRLFRACSAKNQRLMSTRDGNFAFKNAFFNLIKDMDAIITAFSSTKTLEERKKEALNFMIEILTPMQSQSEDTSNLMLETLIQWIETSPPGNLLMLATLEGLGHMNQFIPEFYHLLESSIEKYFYHSDYHEPSWMNLLHILAPSLNKLDLVPLMQGQFLFILHIFIIFKLQQINNSGDKIVFLQDLIQLLENLKTGAESECRLALVWGSIISKGCLILMENENAKKPLTMLARSLQFASTQSEGWGNSLLGAVGLKKEAITNKRRCLTRCLACVILSAFPDKSAGTPQPNQEYNSALRELQYLIANKKFQDVKPLIVRSISILNEDQLPDLRAIPHITSRLIDLFYESKCLTTAPEIWDFDFKLN